MVFRVLISQHDSRDRKPTRKKYSTCKWYHDSPPPFREGFCLPPFPRLPSSERRRKSRVPSSENWFRFEFWLLESKKKFSEKKIPSFFLPPPLSRFASALGTRNARKTRKGGGVKKNPRIKWHATRCLKNALSQDWSFVWRSNLFCHTLWTLPTLLGLCLVFLDVRIKIYARLIKEA